ncbi:unnamed protein product [Chrysoparadoxa australica]
MDQSDQEFQPMRMSSPAAPRSDEVGLLDYESSPRRWNSSHGFRPWLASKEGKICRGVVWLLVFLIMMFVAITRLGAINTSLKEGFKAAASPPGAVDFNRLKPTLTEHPGEKMTVITTAASSAVMFLRFPASVISSIKPSLFIFSATYAAGVLEDGEQLALLHFPAENTDQTVFYFKLAEDLSGVDLMRRQLDIKTSRMAVASSTFQSAPDKWITTLPTVAMEQVEGSKEIFITVMATDLISNGFYVSDVQPLMVANQRVKSSTLRSFPRNADITIEYELRAAAPDPHNPASLQMSTVPVSLRFSMALLPEEPMLPRIADDRVGYFTTSYTDLGDHREQVTGAARESSLIDSDVILINRRRMVKGQPLRYYIDPTVPPQWRDALKQGVEAWQPAFAAVGLGDEAIKAVLPDDIDWPQDYDAADVRFNSITWAVDMNEVFAIGPSTLDPRSGEILRSNIIFTEGWIKVWTERFERLGEGGAPAGAGRKLGAAKPRLPGALEPLWDDLGIEDHHHHYHPEDHDLGVLGDLLPSLKDRAGRHKSSARHHSRHTCQHMRFEDASVDMARLMRESAMPEGTLEKGLRDVTMHEVGHTLGLRHNMHGSTSLTLQQAQDPAYTAEHGLTSSVMDYLPLNQLSKKLRSEPQSDIDFFTPGLGEYDMWAIQYGYMEVENEAETMMLVQHPDLAAVASKGMPFATDEDGDDAGGIDPLVSVFDLGSEPLDYYADQLDLVEELRPEIMARAVVDGEPYTLYGPMERTLLSRVMHAGEYSAKYIGGFEFSKQKNVEAAGAGVSPMQTVSPERQRKALALLLRVIADDPASQLFPSPDTLPFMVQKPEGCSTALRYCLAVEPVDAVELKRKARQSIILALLDERRLSRLSLQSWAAAPQVPAVDPAQVPLSIPELFKELTDAVWGPDLFKDDKVEDMNSWSLMLWWVDVLAKLGSMSTLDGVDGQVTAAAAGELHRLDESVIGGLESSAASWALTKAFKRRYWGMHGCI